MEAKGIRTDQLEFKSIGRVGQMSTGSSKRIDYPLTSLNQFYIIFSDNKYVVFSDDKFVVFDES